MSFLNPFFSFSARKKRTVSIFQEKKEGRVPTVVLNLTQKISAISCPSRQALPPERSLRSAHRGVRRSQLHSASAGAAKAPYPLAPSSFPNCDRCAGSQFGDTGPLRFRRFSFFSSPGAAVLFFLKKRKKRMGAQKGGRPMVAPTFTTGSTTDDIETDEGAAEKIGGFLFARKSGIIKTS